MNFEVELEVIEIHVVKAENKEDAIREAKRDRYPQGEIVSAVAEEIEESPQVQA